MSDSKDIQTTHNNLVAQEVEPHKAGHNALLSAAAAILTQSTHLRQGLSNGSLESLQTHLVELVQHFMREGQEKNYPAPILLAGRYFLCAALDELLTHASWMKKNEWEQLALLSFFKQEPAQSNRFFLILQRACENPADHIDLIELGFHCLSIGFMGEYRSKANGAETIAKLMDKLYQIIQETRGETPKALFMGPTPSVKLKTKRISWQANRRWAGITWGACVVLFLALLFPYKSKLNDLAEPIHQVLKTMTQKTG